MSLSSQLLMTCLEQSDPFQNHHHGASSLSMLLLEYMHNFSGISTYGFMCAMVHLTVSLWILMFVFLQKKKNKKKKQNNE